MIRPVEVRAQEGYWRWLRYEDGSKGTVDLSELASIEAKPLARQDGVGRQRSPDYDRWMPTVLRSGPYRLFFYSADRGELLHIHSGEGPEASQVLAGSGSPRGQCWFPPAGATSNREACNG